MRLSTPWQIALITALAVRASLALEADFHTSRGIFTVVLEPEKTPLTTANFIRLAEGGSLWRSAADGALFQTPWYDGLTVNTTVQGLDEVFFETGEAGTPGYEFQDEFHPALGHVPYVVTMATHAPNTNGAAIRIFGAQADAARDGRQTVFGSVAAGPGRPVVDAIIAAGKGTTDLHGVTIREKDAWLELLATAADSLPAMHPVQATLSVTPGVSSTLVFQQPASSVLAAHASEDLQEWQPLASRFLDASSAVSPSMVLDGAELQRRFYQPSLAVYPDQPPGVAALANTTLEIQGPGIATLIYAFDSSGTAGTYQNVISLEPPPLVFSGNFTVVMTLPPRLMPHSLQLLVRTPGLGGSEYQWIRIGWDENGSSGPLGRHITLLLDSSMNPIFEDEGHVELSRP